MILEVIRLDFVSVLLVHDVLSNELILGRLLHLLDEVLPVDVDSGLDVEEDPEEFVVFL